MKEPLDSTVLYATPQKKNKPKKSRKEPQEITTSGESSVKHEIGAAEMRDNHLKQTYSELLLLTVLVPLCL